MTDIMKHDILIHGDKMISKIILEDVLNEMIDNICYAKLKSNTLIKKK